MGCCLSYLYLGEGLRKGVNVVSQIEIPSTRGNDLQGFIQDFLLGGHPSYVGGGGGCGRGRVLSFTKYGSLIVCVTLLPKTSTIIMLLYIVCNLIPWGGGMLIFPLQNATPPPQYEISL